MMNDPMDDYSYENLMRQGSAESSHPSSELSLAEMVHYGSDNGGHLNVGPGGYGACIWVQDQDQEEEEDIIGGPKEEDIAGRPKKNRGKTGN